MKATCVRCLAADARVRAGRILSALLLTALAISFTSQTFRVNAAGPSVVRFSAATYNVQENLTFVTVTVLRTGDVSGPATVDYSTTGVTAAQWNDYTFAQGTLRFAANETSKDIDLLISEDIKIEGTETFTITLSNGTGQALLGSPATASISILDDPIEGGANPINFVDVFVGQHYHDFLGRQSDSAGETFWENQISSCNSNAACLDERRVNVSAAFFLSIEFQQSGYFVIRAHKAAFGNNKTVPRYFQFLHDQRRVTDGVVVGVGNWAALLDANRQAFLEEFVLRPEFISNFPQGQAAAVYVDNMFANEGVIPTVSERQTAITAYGPGNTVGRAAALKSVIDSDTVFNFQYNSAFVLMQYFGYLRRDADDPPDNNFAGYDFWLTKMNQFSLPGENLRDERVALNRAKRADMVKSFIDSGEYRFRFGP
jgi:hypothetical protein